MVNLNSGHTFTISLDRHTLFLKLLTKTQNIHIQYILLPAAVKKLYNTKLNLKLFNNQARGGVNQGIKLKIKFICGPDSFTASVLSTLVFVQPDHNLLHNPHVCRCCVSDPVQDSNFVTINTRNRQHRCCLLIWTLSSFSPPHQSLTLTSFTFFCQLKPKLSLLNRLQPRESRE